MDLLATFSCDQVYQLAHRGIKRNLSRARVDKLFRNPTMPTISNFTLSHIVFRWLKDMFYARGKVSWKFGKVCYNHLADQNNYREDDYKHLIYCNPVECIAFLIQQPVFREQLSYAQIKEFNEAKERTYSEVKSSDWLWDEEVC